MAINRIKYVNIGSKMEESDFVKHSSGGYVLQPLTVTENGTYLPPEGVDGFNRVVVNVVDNLSIKYEIVDGTLKQVWGNVMDFSGVKDIKQDALNSRYANVVINQGISFPDLEQITGSRACSSAFSSNSIPSVSMPKLRRIYGEGACQNMFSGQYGALKTIDFSGLEEIGVGDYAVSSCCFGVFSNCTGLEEVNLSKLRTIKGRYACRSMFSGSGVRTVDLSGLVTIDGDEACGYMFQDCGELVSVIFLSLTNLSGTNTCISMFQGCSKLTSLSFPAITTTSFGEENSQFYRLCYGLSNITLHFPSNVQSVIEGLEGYSATKPFGANSGQVLFDLPPTE